VSGSHHVRHRAGLLALTLFASLLSCGREITGPGGRGVPVAIHFVPDFRPMMVEEVDGTMHSVAGLVPFTRVRIELRRSDNTVAASSVVEFPADADSIPLNVLVPLGNDATADGEVLSAFLRYINAAGDTVFAGGPVSVMARRNRNTPPPPVVVPLAPTVPGATFARIDVSPDTAVANSGQTVNFTATGYDESDVVVPNAIIGFISRNPALAAVPSLASGTVNLVGARGTTWIVAQSLTGVRDSAFVRVLPVPSAIVKASGDAQTALTNAPFTQPLRVRVLASDALGVAGVTVNFVVTSGGGDVSTPSAVTDTDGFAEVNWTAGPTPGAATVTASVASPALSTVFTGSQLASDAASLTFESQPTNITGGNALPGIEVAVRNGANQIIPTFGGAVTLSLTGGTAGAALVGTTTANAVEGVATFTNLTVNKGGTGYRLVATYDQLPPAQSNQFDVAAPPVATAVLLGGGSQSAPPSTPLPDSIRVRFTDSFENPVVGATVTFSILSGGGSLSTTSATTDIDGRAGVVWTVGESGSQQMRAAIGGVGVNVNATVVVSEGISLFAGFDYTYVPIGGSRGIPIYLTNPSPTPVTVNLSVDDPIGTWSASSVIIPAGQTVITPSFEGVAEGVSWVRMTSAVGDDSVSVTVVQSNVGLLLPVDSYFETGDTLRMLVQLSSPAGPGGVLVTVQSLRPELALVAAGTGAGRPVEACVSSYYCYGGGALADGADQSAVGPMNIIGTPSVSVGILVPEGQVFGNLTVVIADDENEEGWFDLEITAPNHAGQSVGLAAYRPFVAVQYMDYYLNTTIGTGQYLNLRSTLYDRSPLKGERVITVTNTNPSVISVPPEVRLGATDYASPAFRVRGLTPGTARLVFTSPGASPDSIDVTVTAPRVRISALSTYLPQQSVSGLKVTFTAEGSTSPFWADVPVNVTLRTDNPSVIQLSQTSAVFQAGAPVLDIPYQTVGMGFGWVVVEVDGLPADSVQITTFTAAPTTFTPSASAGVGLITPVFFQIPYSMAQTGMRTLTVSSLNVGVVRPLTPTVQIGGDNTSATVYVLGTGVGSTNIQVSGPGLALTNVSFSVAAARTVVSANTSMPADSIVRSASSYLADASTTRAPYDTVRARLRSTDPSVIDVTDSLVTFSAVGGAISLTGKYRPVAPGTARLWLVPEDVSIDSSLSALITVQPFTLVPSGASAALGQRLAAQFSVYRSGPTGSALPLDVQQTGPGAVEVTEFSPQFGSGLSSTTGLAVGRTLGADTLVLSAAGYSPVPLPYTVVQSWARLQLYGSARAGQLLTNIEAVLSEVGQYAYRTPGERIVLRVRSLTESTASVEVDSIVFEPFQYYPESRAAVRFLEVGIARLVVEDVDGIILPDTLDLFVEPRSLTGGYYSNDVYDRMAIGMGQRTDDYDVYITRGHVSAEPLWVHLQSSNPSLVQVPDSVLIPAWDDYTYIIVTAGDTVGSARVVASAPGYNEYELDVIVTRGEIEQHTYQSAVGVPTRTAIYVVDALTRSSRRLASPVPMRFTTDRNDILDTAGTSFTYPTGTYYFETDGPTPSATGSVLLRVEDDRPPGFTSMLPGTDILDVGVARFQTSFPDILRLTPGMRRLTTMSAWSSLDFISVSATATSAQGRFSVTPDAFDASGYYSTQLSVAGVSLGVDTLVFSAPNHVSDTTMVIVEAGDLVLEQGRQALLVGDSVLVRFRLRDAASYHVAVTDATTFTFVADTTIVVSNGSAPITSVIVPVDAETFSVWVKSTQAGVFTLSITSPNFRTYQLPLQAVERPE
jgi:hypothetical protein